MRTIAVVVYQSCWRESNRSSVDIDSMSCPRTDGGALV